MNLLFYTARRIGLTVFVLLGVILITFFLTHSISSNPIAAWLGKAASMFPQLAATYERKYHLNEPMYIQFWYYVSGLLHGDLGYSVVKGKPVAQAIIDTLPFTLQIAFFAFVISLVIGIPFGVLGEISSQVPGLRDKGILPCWPIVASISDGTLYANCIYLHSQVISQRGVIELRCGRAGTDNAFSNPR